MVDGRRQIKPFAGDMDDYARFVFERAKRGSPGAEVNGKLRTWAGEFDVAAAARLAAKKAAKKRRRSGL